MRFKYLELGVHDFLPRVKPIAGAKAICMAFEFITFLIYRFFNDLIAWAVLGGL